MAGFDNEVMFSLGERLLPSTSQAISLMQQTATDVATINYTGDPNGNVAANPSSVCHDPVSGNVYYKQTGTGNTGWLLFQNAVSTDNATPQFSNGVLDFGLDPLMLGNNLPVGATLTNSVSYGFGCFNSVTLSTGLTAIGNQSQVFNSTGQANTSVGSNTLQTLTDASGCTAVGFQALQSCNQSGITGVGFQALQSLTDASQCCAFGYQALYQSNTSGNTAIGFAALQNLSGGNGINTVLGGSSGQNLASGSFNILIGQNSGTNYTTSESSNILIGSDGVINESNTIRIGTNGSSNKQQNRTFVAGVTGATVSGSAPVAIDTNGQLSSLGFGTSGQVLTSNGASTSPTWKNNTNFYSVNTASTNGTLTASTSYYITLGSAPTTNVLDVNSKFICPLDGNITKIYMLAQNSGTLSSSELATLSIYNSNAGTTAVFNNVNFSIVGSIYADTSLNIPVISGSFTQFILDTPAWTTAPTGAALSITIVIE